MVIPLERRAASAVRKVALGLGLFCALASASAQMSPTGDAPPAPKPHLGGEDLSPSPEDQGNDRPQLQHQLSYPTYPQGDPTATADVPAGPQVADLHASAEPTFPEEARDLGLASLAHEASPLDGPGSQKLLAQGLGMAPPLSLTRPAHMHTGSAPMVAKGGSQKAPQGSSRPSQHQALHASGQRTSGHSRHDSAHHSSHGAPQHEAQHAHHPRRRSDHHDLKQAAHHALRANQHHALQSAHGHSPCHITSAALDTQHATPAGPGHHGSAPQRALSPAGRLTEFVGQATVPEPATATIALALIGAVALARRGSRPA